MGVFRHHVYFTIKILFCQVENYFIFHLTSDQECGKIYIVPRYTAHRPDSALFLGTTIILPQIQTFVKKNL